MHSYSYLNTTKQIIQSYDGRVPLTTWLKQFFKADKKFGSKDRKNISHACYCFYRLGNAFQDLSFEEKMLTALFLCSDVPNKILEELKPEWNEKVSLSLTQKINLLSAEEEIKKVFPFSDDVNKEIELQSFNRSFLIQPNLYLRIRPGKKQKVLKQLQDVGLQFTLSNDDCIQLSNQTKVDEVLNIDEDVVIQDYNSQKTIELFNNFKLQIPNSKLSIWDCCAASGGKSLLFHDHFPDAQLTVSDVRESILINLEKRFKRAGISNYNRFVADISSPHFSIQRKFDLLICDAPCSGSGTWSRTPEQLLFFKKEKIDHYVNLQKQIASNALKAVKKNGYFLYITCSVFEKENEEVVNFIQSNSALQLKAMEYLKGYDKKADTLFVALFSFS
jgi:16S rRNA (cytosine967-C5)-methyltransferase